MAVKLGAREVFLYEAAEVAGVAAKVLNANGARNCHLIPCHSTEMVDPPRVDVVVSETLGNYALEEHIIETLADAKKRFLKPGGVLIPRRVEQFVAPVVSGRVQAEFDAWDMTGFDLSVAKAMSLNNIYVRTFGAKELLEAKAWDAIELGVDSRSARKGEATWKLKAATTLYGFATWWSAELAPGIALSTAPEAPRTHWEQLYLPLLQPIVAKAGETIAVNLRSRTSAEAGTHVAWVAVHRDAKGREVARQSLNLDKGFLP
jgi:protein arginine N-methyltransferase 1